jgi:hypothetical protein
MPGFTVFGHDPDAAQIVRFNQAGGTVTSNSRFAMPSGAGR